jgi:plasmid stability protein
MPTSLTLKGIPDPLYQRLKASAGANHRSLNSEVIACIEAQLLPRRVSAQEHLTALRAAREHLSKSSFEHGDIDRFKRQGRA